MSKKTDSLCLELSEVIDAAALKEMMEDYHAVTGFGAAIIDMKGKILVGIGWQDICTKFHRVHPESCKFCLESDVLLSKGVPLGTFKAYRCKNNMWDLVTPIMLGDEHIGNIFMGQILYKEEELDLELFSLQARHFGYDEESYISALERVPRFSRESVSTAMGFYSKLARLISKLYYDNHVLKNAIHESEQAKLALKMSEDRYAVTLAAVNIGVWDCDLTSGSCYYSDLYYKLLGHESGGFAPTYESWRSLVHSEDIDRVENDLKNYNGSQLNFSHHFRMKKKNGEWLWVSGCCKIIEQDSNGKALRMLGTLEDISAYKSAEEALKKSEERHRLLFTTSCDALSTVEPPSWNYTSCNPAKIKLLGARDEADFLTRNPSYYSPEQQPDGRNSHEKSREMFEIAMRDGFHFFEWTHKRLSGEVFLCTILLTRMEIDDKQFLQSTVRDISEQKKNENEKIQLKAQLYHSSKLASIGTFAAGIAHEINNPMTIISGHLEIMAETCKDICQKGNLVRSQRVRNAVGRVTEIVNGLRTYARKDEEKIEKVDMHLCIADALLFVSSFNAGADIQLEKHLDARDFLVKANMGKLQQVLVNIIGNAKDALNDIPNGMIKISTENKSNGLEIKITDNGPGIPDSVLAQIFDPFFTTKDPGKGTGLGLSICHSIIESFGGTIGVETELAKGTSFTIFLPIDPTVKSASLKACG